MKLLRLLSCASLAAPAVAASELTLLQSVDVSETMPSTDGGVAELYRVSGSLAQRGRCRIEAVHYGESGRMEYRFEFGPDLNHAESRDYDYNLPYYMEGGGQVASVTIESMSDGDAGKFRELFPEYKAVFDAAELRKCAES